MSEKKEEKRMMYKYYGFGWLESLVMLVGMILCLAIPTISIVKFVQYTISVANTNNDLRYICTLILWLIGLIAYLFISSYVVKILADTVRKKREKDVANGLYN